MYKKFFQLTKRLGEFRSVICLNGDLPPKEFFALSNLPIIAADGASRMLHEIGIEPLMIIGDLDSTDPSHFIKTPRMHVPCQNNTDFQKTLKHLRELDLAPSIITGINGGYIDHILLNISIFSKTDSIFYTNNQLGKVVSTEMKIDLPLNTKISILGLSNSVVNSDGLKWELEDYELDFFGNNSCFNRTVKKEVSISVIKGKVLVIIYLEDIEDCGGSYAK